MPFSLSSPPPLLYSSLKQQPHYSEVPLPTILLLKPLVHHTQSPSPRLLIPSKLTEEGTNCKGTLWVVPFGNPALPGISEDLSLDTGLKKLIASLRYSISLHYYLFLNYKKVPKARLFFFFFFFLFCLSQFFSYLVPLEPPFLFLLSILQSKSFTALLPTKSLGLEFSSLWSCSPALVQCHSSPCQISALQGTAVADLGY